MQPILRGWGRKWCREVFPFRWPYIKGSLINGNHYSNQPKCYGKKIVQVMNDCNFFRYCGLKKYERISIKQSCFPIFPPKITQTSSCIFTLNHVSVWIIMLLYWYLQDIFLRKVWSKADPIYVSEAPLRLYLLFADIWYMALHKTKLHEIVST